MPKKSLPIDLLNIDVRLYRCVQIWMVKIWQIFGQLSISPSSSSAKVSLHMVCTDMRSNGLRYFRVSPISSSAITQCLQHVFGKFGLPNLRICFNNTLKHVSAKFLYFKADMR